MPNDSVVMDEYPLLIMSLLNQNSSVETSGGEYGLPIPEGVSAGLAHATSGLSGVGRSRGPYQNIDPEPVIES